MEVRPPVLGIKDKLNILKIALEDIALSAQTIELAIEIANGALEEARIYKKESNEPNSPMRT